MVDTAIQISNMSVIQEDEKHNPKVPTLNDTLTLGLGVGCISEDGNLPFPVTKYNLIKILNPTFALKRELGLGYKLWLTHMV